mmetsp:Transcript_21748/g.67442  ORF Transcript_21748/g.67442 Transcript_21748/m.67442 type:complete len:203 (-) Transcript_21748:412-1020(-)
MGVDHVGRACRGRGRQARDAREWRDCAAAQGALLQRALAADHHLDGDIVTETDRENGGFHLLFMSCSCTPSVHSASGGKAPQNVCSPKARCRKELDAKTADCRLASSPLAPICERTSYAPGAGATLFSALAEKRAARGMLTSLAGELTIGLYMMPIGALRLAAAASIGSSCCGNDERKADVPAVLPSNTRALVDAAMLFGSA